jgi:hypothetical protein
MGFYRCGELDLLLPQKGVLGSKIAFQERDLFFFLFQIRSPRHFWSAYGLLRPWPKYLNQNIKKYNECVPINHLEN